MFGQCLRRLVVVCVAGRCLVRPEPTFELLTQCAEAAEGASKAEHDKAAMAEADERIAYLRAQVAALAGFKNREAVARREALQKELAEACHAKQADVQTGQADGQTQGMDKQKQNR